MGLTIDAMRRFNRFYTQHVGALDARFLGTELTLAEGRLLYEISRREGCVAADLQEALGMDAAFVSRVLRRFQDRGWIIRVRGEIDTRRRPITLTADGRTMATTLDQRQQDAAATMLEGLDLRARADLAAAFTTIRLLLDPKDPSPFTIRPFQTGDIGLIASRQSKLYADVYGWGRPLEIIEGETTTAFLRAFKPGREQCWVAEIDGLMVGSIFLTDEGAGLSRLRLVYVEPFARRRGIANALVATCVDFARKVGYDAITLWTHTILADARRVYAAQGFTLANTEWHEEFGVPLQGETWRLVLGR